MDLTNSMATKPQFVLPYNPQTYYGSSVAVENLQVGTKLYIGTFNRVQEVIVNQIQKDENGFQIHTDTAVYLASPNTRLQYSSSY